MKEVTEDKGRIRPVVEGDFQCDEQGNSTRFYEVLSIVGIIDNTTKLSYISKKNVPIGTPITNEEYWYPFQVIAVPKGDKGDDGKSAYDLYVESGGTIETVEEWLASLKGKDGSDGADAINPQLRLSEDGMSIEISGDDGKTWYTFIPDFNKLRVLAYLDSTDDLPTNEEIGAIYGVWNAEAQSGTGAYELYINTIKDWLLDSTITKIYDYDTELPSSAANGTTILIPVTDLTLDKEKVDGYKVYKYNATAGGWVMVLNTAEIYVDKEDIVSHGDNVYALVQGEGRITETKLKEETVVSKKDYCRIVNMTDNALMLIIVQDSKRIFHSIGSGAYMLPNNCGVYLVKDSSVTDDIVIAPSMHVAEPTHLSELEYMSEGIYPYYILTESCSGDIYITPEDRLTPDEDEEQNGLTIETKTTTLLTFKQSYELYERQVGWVYFGTNASIAYHLIQDINEGTETNILSGKAVKDAYGHFEECCDNVNTKINLLAKGVKVTIAVSPTVVYKGVATNVTLTGAMEKSTPSQMQLLDGSTVLATSQSSPITHTLSLNTTDNAKTYKVQGVVEGMTFDNEVTMQARYPIYYGFGTAATGVAIAGNRFSPTTSAVQTYSRTNSADSQRFYILVPSDITDVSQFTMGGAPFVMNDVTTQTINGVSYKVHESGNVYNSGVALSVKASN